MELHLLLTVQYLVHNIQPWVQVSPRWQRPWRLILMPNEIPSVLSLWFWFSTARACIHPHSAKHMLKFHWLKARAQFYARASLSGWTRAASYCHIYSAHNRSQWHFGRHSALAMTWQPEHWVSHSERLSNRVKEFRVLANHCFGVLLPPRVTLLLLPQSWAMPSFVHQANTDMAESWCICKLPFTSESPPLHLWNTLWAFTRQRGKLI